MKICQLLNVIELECVELNIWIQAHYAKREDDMQVVVSECTLRKQGR